MNFVFCGRLINISKHVQLWLGFVYLVVSESVSYNELSLCPLFNKPHKKTKPSTEDRCVSLFFEKWLAVYFFPHISQKLCTGWCLTIFMQDQFHYRGPPPIDKYAFDLPMAKDFGIPKPSWLDRIWFFHAEKLLTSWYISVIFEFSRLLC